MITSNCLRSGHAQKFSLTFESSNPPLDLSAIKLSNEQIYLRPLPNSFVTSLNNSPHSSNPFQQATTAILEPQSSSLPVIFTDPFDKGVKSTEEDISITDITVSSSPSPPTQNSQDQNLNIPTKIREYLLQNPNGVTRFDLKKHTLCGESPRKRHVSYNYKKGDGTRTARNRNNTYAKALNTLLRNGIIVEIDALLFLTEKSSQRFGYNKCSLRIESVLKESAVKMEETVLVNKVNLHREVISRWYGQTGKNRGNIGREISPKDGKTYYYWLQ